MLAIVIDDHLIIDIHPASIIGMLEEFIGSILINPDLPFKDEPELISAGQDFIQSELINNSCLCNRKFRKNQEVLSSAHRNIYRLNHFLSDHRIR